MHSILYSLILSRLTKSEFPCSDLFASSPGTLQFVQQTWDYPATGVFSGDIGTYFWFHTFVMKAIKRGPKGHKSLNMSQRCAVAPGWTC